MYPAYVPGLWFEGVISQCKSLVVAHIVPGLQMAWLTKGPVVCGDERSLSDSQTETPRLVLHSSTKKYMGLIEAAWV